MGGPEMAPHSPQRSGRPGKTVAAASHMGGPEMAPHSPPRSGRPGKTVAALDTRSASAAAGHHA
jgi:hypothetical protein